MIKKDEFTLRQLNFDIFFETRSQEDNEELVIVNNRDSISYIQICGIIENIIARNEADKKIKTSILFIRETKSKERIGVDKFIKGR